MSVDGKPKEFKVNEFQSTENTGLLKEYYPDGDKVGKALKKKREALYDNTKGDKEDEEV